MNLSFFMFYLTQDPLIKDSYSSWIIEVGELIRRCHIRFCASVQHRIDEILLESLFEFESICREEQLSSRQSRLTHFINRFRTPSKAVNSSTSSIPQQDMHRNSLMDTYNSSVLLPKKHAQKTPRNIITILASTLFLLTSFPSLYKDSCISQSIEGLNDTVLSHFRRPFCSRWKGLTILMNLTAVQEWLRSNDLPWKLLDSCLAMCKALQVLPDSNITTIQPLIQHCDVEILKRSVKDFECESGESIDTDVLLAVEALAMPQKKTAAIHFKLQSGLNLSPDFADVNNQDKAANEQMWWLQYSVRMEPPSWILQVLN